MTTINTSDATISSSPTMPLEGTEGTQNVSATTASATATANNAGATLQVSSESTQKKRAPAGEKPSLAPSKSPTPGNTIFADPLAFLQYAGIQAQEDRGKNVNQLLKATEGKIEAANTEQIENVMEVIESLDKKPGLPSTI